LFRSLYLALDLVELHAQRDPSGLELRIVVHRVPEGFQAAVAAGCLEDRALVVPRPSALRADFQPVIDRAREGLPVLRFHQRERDAVEALVEHRGLGPGEAFFESGMAVEIAGRAR